MTSADDARLKAILHQDSNLFLDELADRLTLEKRKYFSVHQVLSALQVISSLIHCLSCPNSS